MTDTRGLEVESSGFSNHLYLDTIEHLSSEQQQQCRLPNSYSKCDSCSARFKLRPGESAFAYDHRQAGLDFHLVLVREWAQTEPVSFISVPGIRGSWAIVSIVDRRLVCTRPKWL